MKFTLYTADCRENAKNVYYTNSINITDEESLKKAVRFDHVSARFKDGKRSNDNFETGNCLMFDCDNSHSENVNDWVTPFELACTFPNVEFAAVYSRNHMKAKGEKAARPKFHAYFGISGSLNNEERTQLKKDILEQFPYFDNKALDDAHFFFGVENPEVEIYSGDMNVDEYFGNDDFAKWDEQTEYIGEGSRNSTMSHIAGKLIKRYGNTEAAYKLFMRSAEKCMPPLPDDELNAIWNSAKKFGAKVSKQDGYIPPEIYGQMYSLRPDDYSDIGQAKVLAAEYAGEMAYTDATEYLCFDGTHWTESRQTAVGRCEEFLDRQLEETRTAIEQTRKMLTDSGVDKDLIAVGGKALEKAINPKSENAFMEYRSALSYRNFVMKRRDMKYITSALQAAKPMLLKNISEFDSQEFLLNTPDFTVNLKNGTHREHRAEDFITKMTSVSPDTENKELWENAVRQFFSDDENLIDYVQQITGLCAIGKVYVESLIIAYGEGSNGKSTFWNAIAKVLGTYSGAMSADTLTMGCKRNVKPEMAELKGKRLVIAAELEEGMRLNTSIVKQLCSTDEITAEKKYKDPFRYTPAHTLVLYTNHLPRVGANDDGTWRRLIVIPFNAKLEGNSDIKNYADHLVQNAGGAILQWVIDGAEKVVKNNFKLTVPQCVKEAVRRYREGNDWLSSFIEECCETDRTYTQKSGEIYQEYRAYCARNGEYTRSTTDFYTGLENAGFERFKNQNRSFVRGLKLKSEFSE
ncbi:MAG: phage/plasmid primase, P4 family [Clostridium sp.]|nr:phage/plasmid primase, P4 family [Clostridium sp.]